MRYLIVLIIHAYTFVETKICVVLYCFMNRKKGDYSIFLGVLYLHSGYNNCSMCMRKWYIRQSLQHHVSLHCRTSTYPDDPHHLLAQTLE
jgi:hypothetical protein